MKRYEQGSVGMRPDPEGSWCEYEEAQAEIERLRQEKADILAAKEIVFAPPAMPEGFVIQELQKANVALHADIARLRNALATADEMRRADEAEIERLHEREMNAKCCHCGGVVFAVEDEWAKAKAEIERLNSELLAERLANIGKVHPCNDSTAANLASALADNERLREENKTFRAAQKACEHCDAPTVAEIERLRGFARRVLRVWPDSDLDGGDLQDAAIEAGLLVRRHVTEIPCGPGCRCVDYYDDDDLAAGRHVCYERVREALGDG